MLRSFGLNQLSAAEIIAERENVLKLLAQTTKEKMCKSYHKYTINPKTRYQHIARSVELQQIIECQIDSDNPQHQFDEFHLPLWFNAKANADFDRKCKLLRFCQQALSPNKIKIINFKALNWADGRALTALVSKFRKDLIDYPNLLSYNDPDYMLDQVFTALEQEYGIQRPCCSQLAWANQSDERRIDFIEEVFNTLRCDPTSAAQILSPSVVKTALNSRKRVKKFDGMKMKRSEQIKRRAGDLLNAMASTSSVVMEHHNSETADDDEIISIVSTEITPQKQEYRIEFQNSTTSNSYFQKPSSKTYTPRPVVDKLNPMIVCKVEQIVNGSLQRDHYKSLYEEKHRAAEKVTKKMEKESLEKIEEILEQTGNGTLIIDKNHQQSLSSQEEKEIDEKLAKAEAILKFNNLAGINTVSEMRKQKQQPTKIPPPTPPKPSAMPSTTSASFDEERENRAENGVVFRTTKLPFRRPVSSPQDLYASVLPRRRNLCALCGIEVYLAEQMHIDKLMIHKKCFKCSYCLQPLRLGNSALDRSLMDEFGPRWYCSQHNMIHISEKIARIQKNENKNRASVAVVPPSSSVPAPSRP
uniref:LIM zinc-binding domain-containing protein n=1 Tax=Panagrolaimus sp. ES5 TaxID=591445 RepID=A0AC34G2F5_9BILA